MTSMVKANRIPTGSRSVVRRAGPGVWSKRAGRVMLYTLLVVFLAFFMLPMFWLVITAFKTPVEYGSWPIVILPQRWQWKNFHDAVTRLRNPTYPNAALRSLGLAALNGIPDVLTSALVGFGFARHRAPGRNLLFTCMLAMIMVPGLIRTIPTFVIFARLGLINTYWPWLLWGLGSSPYFVFLFRQYFAGFPKELEDAAEIDGCNRWATFWRIFIPNAGPILAVCSIFSFQGNWGDFFTPVIFLKRRQATLAVAMADAYTDPMGNQMITLTLAGVVLFLIPAIIAFALGYRYIKEVAPTSGLKG